MSQFVATDHQVLVTVKNSGSDLITSESESDVYSLLIRLSFNDVTNKVKITETRSFTISM